MVVKVFKVLVLMMCLTTMHSPQSLCDTDLFHQALSNFSSKKHLADVQVLTSASPDLDRTQDTEPGPTESELAILSFLFVLFNNTKLAILSFHLVNATILSFISLQLK